MFNEHLTKAHAGQPTCPFCFICFSDYPSIRKHCEIKHREMNNNKKDTKGSEGRKRPCRYFQNGEGQCLPRSGVCLYDHTVIPNNERVACFHKEACTYKPYCIFVHPEGQGEDAWMFQKRKSAKICRYVENGETCLRSACNFFHPAIHPASFPSMRNVSGFQWEQNKEPPLVEEPVLVNIPKLPKRVSVIVRNSRTTEDIQEVNQSLKKMNLN